MDRYSFSVGNGQVDRLSNTTSMVPMSQADTVDIIT